MRVGVSWEWGAQGDLCPVLFSEMGHYVFICEKFSFLCRQEHSKCLLPFASSHQLLSCTTSVVSGTTEPLLLHHQPPCLCSDHHLFYVNPTLLLKLPASGLLALTTRLSHHCFGNTGLILQPGSSWSPTHPHNSQEHDVSAGPSLP